ncbi:MAG: dTDP-4-amino-4,6-dideoxygalactose transaminase [Synergistaceae bacterium]|jgi:dTDP-4-amino-4,6-dideoxygalactose transaminase|nr:dTDP-4-amino-4,6-dideoxygalactose transaminase [Synergistaceae bacterium]
MIPFNKPFLTGNERIYIEEVLKNGRFSGNNFFSKKCASWLEEHTRCSKAIVVPSGTAALEMMMILANIGPGDEVILPSFTFSSTANAVVLRGAAPVFADIRPDTMNIDEKRIEAAITSRTKAICPVYYAGAACDMEAIESLAKRHGLLVLPDAAQAIGSVCKGRPLCSYGQMAALSFHETKNLHCGEGGALLINDASFVERGEIVMEKGTDRSKFFRGEIDKYSWVDIGSSFLVNEITAAFLYAQLEQAEKIIERRVELWNCYYRELEPLEKEGKLRRPASVEGCTHNGHIFWILLNDAAARDRAIYALKEKGIGAVFHYVPLHDAPMGLRFSPRSLPTAAEYSARLLRLPLYAEMTPRETAQIAEALSEVLSS